VKDSLIIPFSFSHLSSKNTGNTMLLQQKVDVDVEDEEQ
jgi:hypothetical protein